MKTRLVLNQIKESMCEAYNKGKMSGTVNIIGFDGKFINSFMVNEKEISKSRGLDFDFNIKEGVLEYKFVNKGEENIAYLELINDDEELILDQIYELIDLNQVAKDSISVPVAGVNMDRIKTILSNNPKIKDCTIEDSKLRISFLKQEKEESSPQLENESIAFVFAGVLLCLVFGTFLLIRS